MAKLSVVETIELPSGGSATIQRWRFGRVGGAHMVVVAGIRGDTPEGVRVAFHLIATLKNLEPHLLGSVDVYPCVNPLAAEQGQRLWPFFGVDLNRLFPGKANGHPPYRIAHRLVKQIREHPEPMVVELRGARPAFAEIPQALVRHGDSQAIGLAENANIQLVWQRRLGPAAAGTFAYQFPHTVVLEGGRGNRLSTDVGQVLHDGLCNLLCVQGILPEDALPFHWASIERPAVVDDEHIVRVQATASGLFLPCVELNQKLEQGERIGTIMNPTSGEILKEICVSRKGRVIALREVPVVSLGMMVARILAEV